MVEYGKFIKINGIEFPFPKRSGVILTNNSYVNQFKNAEGTIVGEKVGRSQYAIEGLEWPVLDADVWSMMCIEFEKYVGTIEMVDMVNNVMRTLTVTFGKISAEPFIVDKTTGLPTSYINCKCNITDVGVLDE